MSMPPSSGSPNPTSWFERTWPIITAMLGVGGLVIAGMVFAYGWGKDTAASELALYKGVKDIDIAGLTSKAVAATTEMRDASKGLSEILVTNKQFLEAKKSIEELTINVRNLEKAYKTVDGENESLKSILSVAQARIKSLTALGITFTVRERQSVVVPDSGLHYGLTRVNPSDADVVINGTKRTTLAGDTFTIDSDGKRCSFATREVVFVGNSSVTFDVQCRPQ